MPKELLINVSGNEETRIALLEDGRLEELYMERTSSTSHVGNIYKGRVTNVEASIQAAFIDFGLGRNGFLHISDLLPTYFGRRGEEVEEYVGKKMARRDRPPIQRCLRRGDEIIVQVIKEGIGTKGPTLSAYLSISGKMLVMMPGVAGRGVSKKIEDEEERRRLKQILMSLNPPEDCGFIIRTEAVGKTKAEVERDLKYLARLWEQIKKTRDGNPAPIELYTEGDLITRTVRDIVSSDVDRVVVDDKEVAKRVKDVIKITSPRGKNKVDLYEEPVPLFHQFGIEREIELMYSRHVPLPGGGGLVIDSTEAIVAIDVNSGKFRDHNDAEMTAFKTDMEAADEIPRQLKLRDLGGVIICDFIDLRYERHRRELEERLYENFKKDKAKTKLLRMSQFGIIELTRSRRGPSLKRAIYFDCPHCKGAGLVKTPESMSLDLMRKLSIALNDLKVIRAQVSVCPDVAFFLLNNKRAALTDLEQRTGKRVLIKTDSSLGLDEHQFDLLDARDGQVILEEIGMTMSDRGHVSQAGVRPADRPQAGRGGRGGRRDQRGRSDGDRAGGDRGREQRPASFARAVEEEREELDEDQQEGERGEEFSDGGGEPAERTRGGRSGRGGPEDSFDREPDSPGIPPVLETEAGDQVAEELADEEMEEGAEASERGRAMPPRQPIPDRRNEPFVNRGRSAPTGGGGGGGRGGDGRGGDGRGGDGRGGDGRGSRGGPVGANQGGRGGPVGARPGGRGGAPSGFNGGPGRNEFREQNENRDDNRGDIRGGGDDGGEGGVRRRRRRRRGRRGRGAGEGNGDPNRQPAHQGPGGFGDQPRGDEDEHDDGPPPRVRPLSIAEMAGQIAGELANELGDGDETDQPLREPGVGTPTMREPADAIGPAAEGGESVNSGQVNDGAADIAGPEGMDEHLQQPGDEQPRRRRRRRGGRRHRRRNGGENGAPQGVENAGSAVAGRGDDGEDDQDEERAEETGEPLESAADSLASGPVVLDAEVAEAEVAPEPQPVKAPTRRRRGAAAAASAAAVEPVVDEGGAGPAAEEPRKRAGTRSRGGTRAASTRSRATSKSAPQRIPPKAGKDDSAASAKPAASAPVVRTGSADKHLVADEPVIPQPLSRPRSYRDLDAIPDDYD